MVSSRYALVESETTSPASRAAMNRTCSRTDHGIRPSYESGATVFSSPIERSTAVMAGPGRPGICWRSDRTASPSERCSAAAIRRRFAVLTALGSPSAVVSRNAATTSTFDVDQACDPDARPSTVTSAGSSSGANAKERPSTPFRDSRPGTDEQLAVEGLGVVSRWPSGNRARRDRAGRSGRPARLALPGAGVAGPAGSGVADGICPQPATMIIRPATPRRSVHACPRPYVLGRAGW